MKENENTMEAVDLMQLKEAINGDIVALSKLDEEAKKKKNEDAKMLIERYRSMTDAVEDRRIGVHDLSFQLLGISLAGLALLYSDRVQIAKSVQYAIVAALGVQIFFSLWALLLFLRQSNFPYYPLKETAEYGNKWKWFYYGNPEIQKINENVIRVSRDEQDTVLPYLRGMHTMMRGYIEEDLNKELSDNIQQLYLLQVHNYYKNRFFLQLVRVRERSIYATLIAIVLGFVIGIIAGESSASGTNALISPLS